MSDDIRWQLPPRPWEVDALDHLGRPARLRIGRRQVDLADIAVYRTGFVSIPNVDGHLLAVSMFMIIGALFILPVVMNLIEPRFLLGGVLFIAIGLSSLGEMRRAHRVEYYRVEMSRHDGASETFATVDAREFADFVATLETAGISAPSP